MTRSEPRFSRACELIVAVSLLFPLFAAAQNYKIAFATPKGIYVMNSGGADVKRLTDDTMALLGEHAWSPDGRRILFFALRKDDEALAEKYNIPFHFAMYVMNADGSDQKRLLDVPALSDAAWSPDGKTILFTSSYEDPNRIAVYVLELAAGKQRRVTELAENHSPSWAPDGQRFAFVSGHPPIADIVAVNVDGSHEMRLAHLPMRLGHPVWSPDGKLIAFVGGRGNGWFLMSADGSNKKRVSKFNTTNVVWAPDSRRLLVIGPGVGFTYELDRATEIRLLSNGPVLEAVYSPDGRKVIYRAIDVRSNRGVIYVVNADGSEWRTLKEDPVGFSGFAVSPLLQ